MGQTGRADVDMLFAQMMGGAEREKEDTSPAPSLPQKREAQTGRTKAGPPVQAEPPAQAEPPVQAETTVSQKKSPRKRGEAGRETSNMACFGRQTLNRRGKVHASYWLSPEILLAIDRRSSTEKLRGQPGEKSMIVERALEEYLSKELKEIDTSDLW